jgi:hypothetical protein
MTKCDVIRNSAKVKECHFMNLQRKKINVLQNQTWMHTCTWKMFPEFFNFLSDYSSARKTDKLCWLLMTRSTDYVTMEALWIVNWQYRQQYGPFIMIITAFHWGTQENHRKPVCAWDDANWRVFAPLTLQWCWCWNSNYCPQQRSFKVPYNTLTLFGSHVLVLWH